MNKNLCIQEGGAVCLTDRGFQRVKRYLEGGMVMRVGRAQFIYDAKPFFCGVVSQS